MPNKHVLDCAEYLMGAHQAYKRIGKDGGRALNEEINKTAMDDAGKQAASVWVDFLQGLADPGWYGNEEA